MTGEGTSFRKGIYRGFSPTTANLAMTVCRDKRIESRIDTSQSFDSLEYQVYISGSNSWESVKEIRLEIEKRLGFKI